MTFSIALWPVKSCPVVVQVVLIKLKVRSLLTQKTYPSSLPSYSLFTSFFPPFSLHFFSQSFLHSFHVSDIMRMQRIDSELQFFENWTSFPCLVSSSPYELVHPNIKAGKCQILTCPRFWCYDTGMWPRVGLVIAWELEVRAARWWGSLSFENNRSQQKFQFYEQTSSVI